MSDSLAGLAERVVSPVLSAAPTVHDAWIVGAYAVLLNRAPDPEGLSGFRSALGGGISPIDMLRSLRSSSEGREKRARLPPDVSEVFVWGAFLLVLGRDPSPVERAERLSALSNGASHEQTLAELCNSTEAVDALRFPPLGVDHIPILADAVGRVANLSDDPATRERITTELAHGVRPIDIVMVETRRRARTWRGRLRARIMAPIIAAEAQAVAAAEAASREARLTRDLVWRVEVRRRREQSAEHPSIRHGLI